MVNKETKEIFSEHMIASTIRKDIMKVKASQEMKAFTSGLQFKSEATKQKDLDLVNLLLIKLEQYAEGWITANACKTGELWRKSSAFDTQIKLSEEALNQFLGELDNLIESLKK